MTLPVLSPSGSAALLPALTRCYPLVALIVMCVGQARLGDVAKARGMSDIAEKAGVGRESLYKSLSMTGNPSFKTIAKVMETLGLKMVVEPGAGGDVQGGSEMKAVIG